ncbi:MAG: hypothetical protein R2777_03480 [Chitinophagales bacterium]
MMDTLYSNNVNLVVNTIEVDTTQAIKSIKTVKSLPFPWKEFLKMGYSSIAFTHCLSGTNLLFS